MHHNARTVVDRYQPNCVGPGKNLRIYLWFAVLAISLVSGCTHDQPITYLNGDLKKIFVLAQKSHKKIFVLITAGDCGKCGHFETFLNEQRHTVEILNKEYICYKVDIENVNEKEIAQIVKCPSYPFPFFFNNDGSLLAFGFPNSANYDITNLNKITIPQYRFSELFNLPLSVKRYKDLVSLNMKAAIAHSEPDKALVLYQKSLDIAPYPYNIRKFNMLANQQQKRAMTARMVNYSPTASDRLLYGDLNDYMQTDSTINREIIALNSTRNKDYILIDDAKNLGKLDKGVTYKFCFRIKNLSKIPLVLNNVMHPCDCIKLEWPHTKILLNQTALIRGEFTPFQSGQFRKEIFIHSSSINTPMGVFSIMGVVI